MATEEILDLDTIQRKMKKWRDEGYRNSEEIADLGENLLKDYSCKLGDETWVLLEQVCIASFDCNRLQLAERCLEALEKQFPKSKRVMKLRGMLYEADGQYDLANRIYDELLEADPANLQVRKRKIAMLKEQNKIEETIAQLNKYLEDFLGDQEAWMELCELYIRQQEFSKAAFCMEELILSHPHNHLYHQRYAEIHYTIGHQENMQRAKKYFAQALKLDPNNVRALYGLYLAATNISSGKISADEKRKNQSLSAWTADQLVELFDMNVSDKQRKTLCDMFDNMQLALPSN